MANDNILGTKLGELMNRNELSAQKLADDLQEKGYHADDSAFRKTISHWENGRMPQRADLVMLADYFHTTTDYILGRTPSAIDDDQIQITARTLGFSEIATQTLIDISCCNGSALSEIVSDTLENENLLHTMKELKKSKDGIERQIKLASDSDLRFQERCVDMADMYVMKAMRAIEPLLRDVLGYYELTGKMGADTNG